jgi:hypothetical protein
MFSFNNVTKDWSSLLNSRARQFGYSNYQEICLDYNREQLIDLFDINLQISDEWKVEFNFDNDCSDDEYLNIYLVNTNNHLTIVVKEYDFEYRTITSDFQSWRDSYDWIKNVYDMCKIKINNYNNSITIPSISLYTDLLSMVKKITDQSESEVRDTCGTFNNQEWLEYIVKLNSINGK